MKTSRARIIIEAILTSEFVVLPLLGLIIWILYLIKPSDLELLVVGGGGLLLFVTLIYRRNVMKLRRKVDR